MWPFKTFFENFQLSTYIVVDLNSHVIFIFSDFVQYLVYKQTFKFNSIYIQFNFSHLGFYCIKYTFFK